MEYIDDLSWSNIINIIQGEEIKGADLINTCANELENVRETIGELESKIQRFKRREQTILNASKDVAKCLDKRLPLTVKRKDYVIQVTIDNLIIERNII